jgi:hypothetical protein
VTRSSATISWTTDVPATTQVEFGTSPLDTARTRVDASLVTDHRQVLTALTPGATYRFRLRSVSFGGGLGVSPDQILVTLPAGSGPEIGTVGVPAVTGSTATIDWSTSTGSVAQVEYGATPNYGSFTVLKVFSGPAQEMVLTNLRPGSDYHFRVKSWDGDGFLGASGDFTFTTAVAAPATLLGEQTLQPALLTLPGGQAAAYQYTATQSGQASLVRLYIEAGTSAAVVRVALYSDRAGSPGAILSQGSGSALTSGWTSVGMSPVTLLKGQRYWLAVLNPIGPGSLNLRDGAAGGSRLLSGLKALAAFPRNWVSGDVALRSPLSAAVVQIPPEVTLMGLSADTVVTGTAVLSAAVDDDAPIALVQFLVDGVPVGAPLAAPPYTAVWDTRGVGTNQPHAISARATDVLGRTSTSGVVNVQVDNGPVISRVALSQGLTASSARVSWTTDVLADAQVEYGTTASYGLLTPVDAREDWRHDMQLTGLAPGTIYHYRVRSRDAAGALSTSADATFFTPEP